MSSIMSKLLTELAVIRRAAGLTHEALADRAGLSRMTIQRTEAGKIDPRLSTLEVMARALGMDIILVPTALRPDLEDFVRSGGRFLGQAAGVGAPPSLVDALLEPNRQKRTLKSNGSK
jgi:transcriptional regulator with XRE-family HTH domain